MKIKIPKTKNKKFIEDFFIKKGLKSLVDLSKKKSEKKKIRFVKFKIILKPDTSRVK